MLTDERAALRRDMLKKRDTADENTRMAQSRDIERLLYSSGIFQRANSIFVYYSIGSEVTTHGIIDYALQCGKSVYLPKCKKGGEMRAISISSKSELKPGKYGIPDPQCGQELTHVPDLCITPGLAFDARGGRIGYGGGYYDRFIALWHPITVALAYSWQVLESVPMGTHDAPMNYIITPAGLIACDERA